MSRYSLVAALLLLAVLYNYLLGYGPLASEIYDDFEWWRPRGWIHQSGLFTALSDMARSEDASRWIPVFLFSIPPLASIATVFALFRGSIARFAVTALGLLMITMAYYGILADRVWRFLEWRFVPVAACLVLIVTSALYAPSLLRSLQRWPWIVRFTTLLAIAGVVFVVSTEVTGTNTDMRANLSPWPVVTVFGMLGFGLVLSALHLAAGAGLLVRSNFAGPAGVVVGLLIAVAVGAVVYFIPFTLPNVGLMLLLAGAAALYTGAAIVLTDGAELRMSAWSRVAAGALLFAMIGGSDHFAREFQRTARDETAHVVLLALEKYRDANGGYPEDLESLVPDQLTEVPRPRIGLRLDFDDDFNYSKYSQDQYALEFASVQWVQCAYSPPYEFSADDGESDDEDWIDEDVPADEREPWEQWDDATDVAAAPSAEGDAVRAHLREAGLAGEWSCSTEPPKLW